MNQQTKAELKAHIQVFYKALDECLGAEDYELRAKIKRSVSGLVSAAARPKRQALQVYPSTLPFWWTDEVSQAWDGWVEMRNLKKKPLTQRAADLSLAELQSCIGPGQSAADRAVEVLDKASNLGWIGLKWIKEQEKRDQQRHAGATNYQRQADYRSSFQEAKQSGAFD